MHQSLSSSSLLDISVPTVGAVGFPIVTVLVPT
jgi:hypothetical protein